MIDKIKLLILGSEMSEAKNDTQRFEIAERIVELDGRLDPADMDQFEIIAAAREIVSEFISEVRKENRQ
jgi:hypothetical protein